MSAIPVQAIPGVSANRETVIMTVYPSIGGYTLGKGLAAVMQAIPIRLWNLKIPAFLFWPIIAPVAAMLWITIGLALAPLGATLFLFERAFGNKYVLTNRQMQIWKSIGKRLVGQVPLNQIGQIEVAQSPSQRFYRAVDLHLLGDSGSQLLTLEAVPSGTVFREIILKARNARLSVDQSLSTLSKRKI